VTRLEEAARRDLHDTYMKESYSLSVCCTTERVTYMHSIRDTPRGRTTNKEDLQLGPQYENCMSHIFERVIFTHVTIMQKNHIYMHSIRDTSRGSALAE